MHRLLAEADVFLTNTRVKALKKLGLDYDSLKDKYPRLIEANISGFGEKGPKKDNPGFDTVAFWASSGFNADMMVEGPGSYPVYSSAGPGDIVTAEQARGAKSDAHGYHARSARTHPRSQR